ncbi:MAG: hypothetical protein HYW15_03615 [Candidatus Giovannonibacteria bacterium]|nr:MAG: hypothetical protein HYW15_03615 [Candidatus Giovannonibacteria bacterium]
MTEIAVQYASRYIKRQFSDAVGKSLLKTLTEPITNSDDSYRKIIESSQDDGGEVFPITIFIDKTKRLVRITDHAQGMTTAELEEKFKEYGAAKSGAYEGFSSRGIFGQGISDVLFYHREGKIKSVKDGEASICNFYWKKERPFISVEKQKELAEKLAKEWGINSKHGTVAEFVLDNTTIHDYDNLIKKVGVFFMLRLINSSDRRSVQLIYKDQKGTKKSVIRYQFPKGDLVEHKEFTLQFEKYNPVKIDVELYKSSTPLQIVGDERENGLLVHDNKEAVYAQTFFGWDSLPGADKFFGFMKLTGAREIILNKINDPKHPEAILSDSRDGFNTQHDFYKKLALEVKDWLYPILNEERRRRSDEGVSEITKENHRKALEELNKLYAQLTGEDTNGVIRIKKKARPVGGIEFARSNITITAGRRYGLQLFIDTRIIKPSSKISLKSSRGKIGFSPTTIEVHDAPEDSNDILVKTIIVTGANARTADTLEAKSGKRSASVVVSIVSEEIVYPENGIVFSPDYIRTTANRESTLNLYVDLNVIKIGKKISLSSSNNSIALKYRWVVVPRRMRSTSQVAKIEVPFVGKKNDESGIVKANFEDYSAQCRIDIKDRIKPSPTGPTGKFKDWDFDDGVPKHLQTTYDPMLGSPTQGFILINSNHPINRYYFGDNPQKRDVEKSREAQLYLAELILSESLGAMIPEAYQKGAIPQNYGPAIDIPVYIAQKKFEVGPGIYDHFVEEPLAWETRREKQLEEAKQGQTLGDKDLVEGMEDREKQMVEMRFGLNDQRPHTLEEIAQRFEITRERVRQIVNKALAKKYGEYYYSDEDPRDYIKEREKEINFTAKKIVASVAQFYNLSLVEIKKRTRKGTIAHARQIAMYLIRTMIGLSFPSIGRIFGLDHTTVLYAFEKISDGITRDKTLREQIDSIISMIKTPLA